MIIKEIEEEGIISTKGIIEKCRNSKVKSKYRVTSKRKNKYKLTNTIYDYQLTYDSKLYPVDKKVFINICKDFFEELSKEIINNKFRFKMPFRLGTIRIQKKKHQTSNNHKRIDWEKTKKLNKKVYHLNLHSGRYYFKWLWDKSLANVKNSNFYKFYPSRVNKSNLAKEIKKRATNPNMKDYDCLS